MELKQKIHIVFFVLKLISPRHRAFLFANIEIKGVKEWKHKATQDKQKD